MFIGELCGSRRYYEVPEGCEVVSVDDWLYIGPGRDCPIYKNCDTVLCQCLRCGWNQSLNYVQAKSGVGAECRGCKWKKKYPGRGLAELYYSPGIEL